MGDTPQPRRVPSTVGPDSIPRDANGKLANGRIPSRNASNPRGGMAAAAGGQFSDIQNALAPSLSGGYDDSIESTRMAELIKHLLGMTSEGFNLEAPPAPGRGPSAGSSMPMEVHRADPNPDPMSDFARRRREADFDRGIRSDDMALDRDNQRRMFEMKKNLMREMLGLSGRGGHTQTSTTTSSGNTGQVVNNAGRYQTVNSPTNQTQTTTSEISPIEFQKMLMSLF